MQTDIRDAAHKLIDHLPTQATWDDLMALIIIPASRWPER